MDRRPDEIERDPHAGAEERAGTGAEPLAPPGEGPGDEAEENPKEPADVLRRWQDRAAAAEETSRTLERELGSARETLRQTREALEASERRRRIDQELIEAEAVDLETARLLTDATLSRMEDPDVSDAVAEVRRRKPFLFRKRGVAGPRAAAPGVHRDPSAELNGLAEDARGSGDRAALLRYLRARRER